MAKKKEEKTKTELRLERLKEKISALESIIAKREEKVNIRKQIAELKEKLKGLR